MGRRRVQRGVRRGDARRRRRRRRCSARLAAASRSRSCRTGRSRPRSTGSPRPPAGRRTCAAIVVSQRVGTIKPHPAIFAAAGRRSASPAPRPILHVGDDWAADVVGREAAGWRAAYLRTAADSPLPSSEPRTGRVTADLELELPSTNCRACPSGAGWRGRRGGGTSLGRLRPDGGARPRWRTSGCSRPRRGLAPRRARSSRPATRSPTRPRATSARLLMGLGLRPHGTSRCSGSSCSAPPPGRLSRRLAPGRRRGGWVALVVALFVVLRLQGAFQWPFVLFIVAMVVVAELTLSVER